MKKSEARIQSECFIWFNNTFPHLRKLLYHVPNGELRDKVTAAKLKAMGVVSGVSDIVFHYRSRTYFFEFKKPGVGRASQDQKDFIEAIERQGFCAWLVDEQKQFEQLITSIIEEPTQQLTHGITREEVACRHSIFQYLYEMEDGELRTFEELVVEENRPKFTKYVNEFITEGYDKCEGFEILITPDYKAIYKKLEGSNVKIDYEL